TRSWRFRGADRSGKMPPRQLSRPPPARRPPAARPEPALPIGELASDTLVQGLLRVATRRIAMRNTIRRRKTSGARKSVAKGDLPARDGRRVKGGLLTTFVADLLAT